MWALIMTCLRHHGNVQSFPHTTYEAITIDNSRMAISYMYTVTVLYTPYHKALQAHVYMQCHTSTRSKARETYKWPIQLTLLFNSTIHMNDKAN